MPIRSGALLHVHYDPVRSVVIGYEFTLNYCLDYDMGDHDLAMIGPNRHINSQADSIHLLPELLQGENYNPRPSIMAGFEVGGWQDISLNLKIGLRALLGACRGLKVTNMVLQQYCHPFALLTIKVKDPV